MVDALALLVIGGLLVLGATAPRSIARKASALLCLAVALSACGPRAEAVAADTIARAVNAATASLAETYAQQGEQLIAAAKTRATAETLLVDHRERWKPVWLAVDALSVAHDEVATAIEAGRPAHGEVAMMRAAWCELVRAVDLADATLPAPASQLPIRCPGQAR
jgi:hypothetical protein